eukprot:TRINITY_DN16418_c0_g1_i1.p1 TRINITY_DN16418_c0_g1~~TRINITY_DN16418_c0_g1_i1.p1  ORF type:complete len:1114 (+),score=232.86 TRINITY_DN16418_c0_g1_i1:115-3456(+)
MRPPPLAFDRGVSVLRASRPRRSRRRRARLRPSMDEGRLPAAPPGKPIGSPDELAAAAVASAGERMPSGIAAVGGVSSGTLAELVQQQEEAAALSPRVDSGGGGNGVHRRSGSPISCGNHLRGGAAEEDALLLKQQLVDRDRRIRALEVQLLVQQSSQQSSASSLHQKKTSPSSPPPAGPATCHNLLSEEQLLNRLAAREAEIAQLRQMLSFSSSALTGGGSGVPLSLQAADQPRPRHRLLREQAAAEAASVSAYAVQEAGWQPAVSSSGKKASPPSYRSPRVEDLQRQLPEEGEVAVDAVGSFKMPWMHSPRLQHQAPTISGSSGLSNVSNHVNMGQSESMSRRSSLHARRNSAATNNYQEVDPMRGLGLPGSWQGVPDLSSDLLWSGNTSASNSLVCTPASLTRGPARYPRGPGSFILVGGDGAMTSPRSVLQSPRAVLPYSPCAYREAREVRRCPPLPVVASGGTPTSSDPGLLERVAEQQDECTPDRPETPGPPSIVADAGSEETPTSHKLPTPCSTSAAAVAVPALSHTVKQMAARGRMPEDEQPPLAAADGRRPSLCDMEALVAKAAQERERVTGCVWRQLQELEDMVAQAGGSPVKPRSQLHSATGTTLSSPLKLNLCQAQPRNLASPLTISPAPSTTAGGHGGPLSFCGTASTPSSATSSQLAARFLVPPQQHQQQQRQASTSPGPPPPGASPLQITTAASSRHGTPGRLTQVSGSSYVAASPLPASAPLVASASFGQAAPARDASGAGRYPPPVRQRLAAPAEAGGMSLPVAAPPALASTASVAGGAVTNGSVPLGFASQAPLARSISPTTAGRTVRRYASEPIFVQPGMNKTVQGGQGPICQWLAAAAPVVASPPARGLALSPLPSSQRSTRYGQMSPGRPATLASVATTTAGGFQAVAAAPPRQSQVHALQGALLRGASADSAPAGEAAGLAVAPVPLGSPSPVSPPVMHGSALGAQCAHAQPQPSDMSGNSGSRHVSAPPHVFATAAPQQSLSRSRTPVRPSQALAQATPLVSAPRGSLERAAAAISPGPGLATTSRSTTPAAPAAAATPEKRGCSSQPAQSLGLTINGYEIATTPYQSAKTRLINSSRPTPVLAPRAEAL